MYDSSSCTPLGTCALLVKNPKTGGTYHLNFMVVQEALVALLGCTASQQLGFLAVCIENIQVNALGVGNGSQGQTAPAMDGGRMAEKFMTAYNDVFNEGLGKFAAVEHLEIDPSVPPVKMPLRKVPLSIQDKLEPELNWLEAMGVIERVTQPTDWVSGMVVAEKRNASLRVCIDPRPLNKALRRSIYPMPMMEDILPRLTKAKFFTVCDVKNGFWHGQLDESSKPTDNVLHALWTIQVDQTPIWAVIRTPDLSAQVG